MTKKPANLTVIYVRIAFVMSRLQRLAAPPIPLLGEVGPSLAIKAMTTSLLASLVLSGCQPKPAPDAEQSATTPQTNTQKEAPKPTGPSAISPSAEVTARIEAYEPKFIEQMTRLQERLQAEYEALNVADDDSSTGLSTSATTSASQLDDNQAATHQVDSKVANNIEDKENLNQSESAETKPVQASETQPALIEEIVNANPSKPIDIEKINANTHDLTILKQVSLEPRAPDILSESEIKRRYQAAFSELYSSEPLSSEGTNTIIDIITLLPDLFEQAELAARLSEKSPALARLIVQHQVWRQIEAQQVLDMQKMKLEQQAEFETLMTKFNETIKGYDEQIVKYEKMLKEYAKK